MLGLGPASVIRIQLLLIGNNDVLMCSMAEVTDCHLVYYEIVSLLQHVMYYVYAYIHELIMQQ